MLPQVLAGLGLLSLLSATCLIWLERLQPLFLALALGALVYQAWIIRRRPPSMRTLGIMAIFLISLFLNLAVIGSWIFLAIRYR